MVAAAKTVAAFNVSDAAVAATYDTTTPAAAAVAATNELLHILTIILLRM